MSKLLRNLINTYLFVIFVFILILSILAVLFLTYSKELPANYLVIIPALVGLVILVMNSRERLYQLKIEENYKKRDIEMRTQDSIQYQEWLKGETIRLERVAKELSKYITRDLKSDINWLSDSMHQAKIGMEHYSNSLFSERLSHFKNEKKFLSEQFTEWFFKRCEAIYNKFDNITLVIDSGTTLFYFLEQFAIQSVIHRDEEWIKKIRIVTNNLPGAQRVIELGVVNPKYRSSKLAIQKCEILGGELLSFYLALVGDKTMTELDEIKKSKKDNEIIIGITVGNWVNLAQANKLIPTPLARGFGHKEIKEKLIEISDEIYVLSPLGKTFYNLNNDLNALNDDLGLKVRSKKAKHNVPTEGYQSVQIKNKAETIKLVTTTRKKGRLFFPHSCVISKVVRAEFDDFTNTEEKDIKDIPHLMYEFDNLSNESYYEEETEIPHKRCRTTKFKEEYFEIK